jgi:hypothetical protein
MIPRGLAKLMFGIFLDARELNENQPAEREAIRYRAPL